MKIFLSFLQSAHSYPVPAYDFWQRYIKNGIQEAGHQWVECPGADWALGIVAQSKAGHQNWKQETWEKTVNWLKKNPVDLFLSYLYPAQVDLSAIKEIQKTGIPCVNFFCDNVREFQKAPAGYSAFDLNWVPEYQAIAMYQRAGYPYIHLPMPVWIDAADRVIKEEKYNQITFLGSKDIQRLILLEEVVKEDPDLPLAIYGSGWDKTAGQLQPPKNNYSVYDRFFYQLKFLKQQGTKAYRNKIKNRSYNYNSTPALLAKCNGGYQFDEYSVLTAESMITIGVNRYPSFHFPLLNPDTYSRLRDIEAPMLGACYLTEWAPGLDELYDIEKEIAVYRTAAELAEKARELLADPAKRKSLRVNGQMKALTAHSVPQSINKIKCTLGL